MKLYNEFANIISRFNSFTLLMHNVPDGDSIASMFALKKILEKKNKRVELAIHSPISENYSCWFDKYKYINKIVIPKDKTDCLIIVDTPDKNKTYEKYKELSDFVVVIDHNKNSVKFGDFNLVKFAPCTGVIIYELLDYLNVKLDKTLAEYLLISLYWDTEGLKNNYTTPYLFQIAAKLVQEGAVPQRVYRYLFEYKKKNDLEIQKTLFNSIKEINKIHYVSLTKDISEKLDIHDIYNFLNYIKFVDDVDAFIFFIERNHHFEIRMNNNRLIYDFLKRKYNNIYNIPIEISFEEDVKEILDKLQNLKAV